jgi:uncharacterized protein YbcV (DUF1398 family)
MNTETISECMTLSFADTPFPTVVQKLSTAGVHAYTADLIALRKTYYGVESETLDEALPLSEAPAVAESLDISAVTNFVRAIQNGKLGYAEFLREIMRAGCASYRVFIDGRKAMYFGRDGSFYSEPLPPKSA